MKGGPLAYEADALSRRAMETVAVRVRVAGYDALTFDDNVDAASH